MKIALKSLSLTAIIYAIIYLFGIIYKFQFYNPFEWISHIPEWEGIRRIGLFIGASLYQIGNHVVFSRGWNYSIHARAGTLYKRESDMVMVIMIYFFAMSILVPVFSCPK